MTELVGFVIGWLIGGAIARRRRPRPAAVLVLSPWPVARRDRDLSN